MTPPKPPSEPTITATNTADYRNSYSNSVQVRMSVWDFFLVFGTMQQDTPDEVKIQNFQGIYLSPQQTKALKSILESNLEKYEQAFGPIALEPQFAPPNGPVH